LKNRSTKSKGKGTGDLGKGGGSKLKKIRLGTMGKILTVDEKTTRGTSKSVTKAV
jgi:hypothetical protein